MRKRIKIWKWMMLILALVLAVWCVGCSSSDDSTDSVTLGFTPTPDAELQARINALKELLPEETYNIITAGTITLDCKESNREELGLPNEPNYDWYYTYDNLISGMAHWEEFANEGDTNTKKLEIAAFLANIAQETGGKAVGDAFGSPGCAIQEGYGSEWGSTKYNSWNGCTTDNTCAAAGYCGRGPHQLSWDYNYKAFGKAMGEGDKYFNDPDLLTKYPKIGIAGSIWFWGHADTSNGQEDKPLKPSAHSVVVAAWDPTAETAWKPTENDKSCGRKTANFGVIINIINGGIECCCNYWGADATQKDQRDKQEEASSKAYEAARRCCVDEPVCDWSYESGVCAAWRCCQSIECISEGCQQPTSQATNRVNYLKAIAEEMGVVIPDGFIDFDCRSQLNFAHCLSYPQ